MLLSHAPYGVVVFRCALVGLALLAVASFDLSGQKPGNDPLPAPEDARATQLSGPASVLGTLRHDLSRPQAKAAGARKKPVNGDANWPKKVTQVFDDYFRLPLGSIRCIFLTCRQFPWP